MKSQNQYARLAGFMFLFVILTNILGDYITAQIEVAGNFPETARKIIASEHVYRFGLAMSFISSLCTVLLAMGLYGVVKPLNKNLALLALIFRIVEAALGAAMSIINFTFLKLYISTDYINSFNIKQLSALVALQSGGYDNTISIAGTFFGMGSIIFFYLLSKSNYLPKFISVSGFFASLLVPLLCLTKLTLPQYADIADYVWLPMGIAEVLAGLWLLFKGVKDNTRTKPAYDNNVIN